MAKSKKKRFLSKREPSWSKVRGRMVSLASNFPMRLTRRNLRESSCLETREVRSRASKRGFKPDPIICAKLAAKVSS